MLYISIDDFFEHANACTRLSRQEEIDCAHLMKSGDELARKRLIESYLPFVAANIKRAPKNIQNLGLAINCVAALEKQVDSFNFLQDSEPFSHRLSWCMRQTVTKYLAK